MLLRSPGFTLVAVLTLAVGIAANTTVFSWLDLMLLRPIPGAAESAELVSFETVAPDGAPLATSYADFRDYRDHLNLVSGLAAASPASFNLGDAETGERIWGEMVSGNYFQVIGVTAVLGRVFSPDEYGDTPGAYPVVVLGHGLWKRRFSGDPRVIGTTLLVNRQRLTIVGVAPPEFRGSMPGLLLELWVPLVMGPRLNVMPDAALSDRNARMFMGVARLQSGITIERARAECSSMARRLSETDPHTNRDVGATLLPVRKSHFGGQAMMEAPLRILMAACGVVFLIVCANIANLLLVRATVRRKEFGLRMAMGAGRWRLMRHLLAESLLLALLGVAMGLPLAMWMSQSLEYLLPRGAKVPLAPMDIPFNAETVLFTLFICLAACLTAGLAPALLGSRAQLIETLKEGGRSGHEGIHSVRLRGVLVASEVALALIAIIGAGLFARSFEMARRIEPGFDPREVLVAHVDLSAAGDARADRIRFCERLRSRFASRPGIAGVSWADVIPMWFTGNPVERLQVEGHVPAPGQSMEIPRSLVEPGYFDLLRIPILQGRDFNRRDIESSPRVMIVNRTFANRFFPGREAIGHRVRGFGEWYTIVGVARDSKYVRPTEDAQPYFYVPFRQAFQGLMFALYIRTEGDPRRAEAMLARELSAIDPAARVLDVMPLIEAISAGLFAHKTAAVMLSVLGVIALLLAAVGLYSVMAYSVAQRTQEIGIRMALGARPSDVLTMVVREGMRLTLAGVVVGVAVALAITRLASGLLVHVSATDPLTFVGASLFLAVVALAASYLPARRATRIDPNDAFRSP